MKTGMTTRVLATVLSVCLLLSTFTFTAIAAGTWTPSDTTEIYAVTDYSTTNADLQKQFEKLQEQFENEAILFAAEYQAKGLGEISVTKGKADKAGDSDILLMYDNSVTNAEGFRVSISGSKLTVAASTADGLFYGWRYVLKELLNSGSVAETEQAPAVAERAVSLDNGRKYFSVEEIQELIREMSYANMNTLVLHFSEEMGLGLESKLYPWLAGRDGSLCVAGEIATDNRVLTQDELREIAKYAAKYHVELVPSFDSPGHMNYIVKKVNEKAANGDFSFEYKDIAYNREKDAVKTYTLTKGNEIGNYFHYNGQTSIVQGSRNTAYSRGIDISNEFAVAFTMSLVEEYAKLFRELGCTKFDIGGDELLGWGKAITKSVSKWKQLDHWKAYAIDRSGNSNAVAYDAFLYYMNDMYELVSGLGYTSVRMWNDDALRTGDTGWKQVVTLNQAINIWYWTAGANGSKNNCWTYANADYQLYNILSDYTYYVLNTDYFGARESFAKAYPQTVYNEWTPYIFDPTSTTSNNNMPTTDTNVLGGAMGIWCDNPSLRTGAEVIEDVKPLMRAIGAKSWDTDANSSVSYTAYTARWDKYGDAPVVDLSALPDFTFDTTDMTDLQAAVNAYYDFTFDPNTHVKSFYDDYTNMVAEAETYYLSEDAYPFTQGEVDMMTATILACRKNLDFYVGNYYQLEVAFREYYGTYGPRKNWYTSETWNAYEEAIRTGEEWLDQVWTDEESGSDERAGELLTQIMACRDGLMVTNLKAAIDEYDGYLKNFRDNLYPIEMWEPYAKYVKDAKELLASGSYSDAEEQEILKAIIQWRQTLNSLSFPGVNLTEDYFADFRHSIINRAEFQSSYGYSGGAVRLAVNTVRSFDSRNVLILDENGFPVVPQRISVAPFNRRKPNQQILYVDMILDVEPGKERTFTIYVVDDSYSSESIDSNTPDYIRDMLEYCGDPITVTINVLESPSESLS